MKWNTMESLGLLLKKEMDEGVGERERGRERENEEDQKIP